MDYDYRDILKQELSQRCAVNPAYSQRALAKKIGMTQGGLSEVLTGRRGLSVCRAATIAEKLGFSSDQSLLFCESVRSHHARSLAQRQIAKAKLNAFLKQAQYTELTNDMFQTIQEWHHLAILELTKLTGFKSTPGRIAQALGISPERSQEAVERLCRLGLLRIRSGKYVPTHAKLEFPAKTPSEAIKSFHHQILSKAQRALYQQPRDKRHFHAVYCAIDAADLPKAQTMLNEFWRNFCAVMNESKTKDQVYCLATQFFDAKEDLP